MICELRDEVALFVPLIVKNDCTELCPSYERYVYIEPVKADVGRLVVMYEMVCENENGALLVVDDDAEDEPLVDEALVDDAVEEL